MPDTPPTDCAGLKAWLTERVVMRLVAAVLAAVTGYLGLKPAAPAAQPVPVVDAAAHIPHDYEGAHIDGGSFHQHASAGVESARWPTDRITYGVDYSSASRLSPPLSIEAVRAAFRQALTWWAEGLDLEFVEVDPSVAQIPVRFEGMDGPGGVLAEAYLADGTSRPKPVRFDSRERWTAGPPAANLVSLPTVAAHEFGHSLGLDHDAPNAPALMRPTYTASLPRPQPRDVERMVALGYRRRVAAPPVPADVLSFPVTARTADVIEALQKQGYKVSR